MFGGINPTQMKAMMRQMGIKQEDIEALKVIIETPEKNIIIQPATVQKIIMQGQTSFQISGQVSEETKKEEISESDIKMVSEKTGKSLEESKKALESSGGDIAESIMILSK